MQRFFGCVQAKACPATDVFSGKALKEWRREVEPMLGKKLVIHNASLVATVSQPKFAAKWQRRWGNATKKLARAGYNRAALSALGNGKGLVRIAPRVALALGTFDMTMRGRQRTEYLLLTMFKQADGWRIVYIEDSPGQHVRFLVKNKPTP